MTFQIMSAGWSCADWLERTLRSVETQTVEDWQIMISYDRSDDNGAELIKQWCDVRDDRWHYQLQDTQRWAVQNQYEGIHALDPAPEDIVVFLDLDGDQLAHPEVFAHLLDYYADGTLLTYGNYEPVPYASTCPPAEPFPDEVVANNRYRGHVLYGGFCCFNHLRTMKGKVFMAIPESAFKRDDGDWYHSGTDYVVMVPALELAGGRYKCLEEVMLLYNNANPLADYIVHPGETTGNIRDVLRRRPFDPL